MIVVHIYCLYERGEDMQSLKDMLPPFMAERLKGQEGQPLWEIRARVGWPLSFRGPGGEKKAGPPLTREEMEQLVGALTGYSLYAWEKQMGQGFFALPGGVRAGVTGRYGENDRLQQITGVCLRMARDMPRCADEVLPHLMKEGAFLSTLILSAPCMGKTTLLRALIGRLTRQGLSLSVCDERGELEGEMLGPCDVAGLCEKRYAIPRLVRSMAPQVIATDELGAPGDVQAVALAARCGAAVLATAHARDYQAAKQRPALGAIMEKGIFERYVVLSGQPGHVERVLDGRGEALWRDGR